MEVRTFLKTTSSDSILVSSSADSDMVPVKGRRIPKRLRGLKEIIYDLGAMDSGRRGKIPLPHPLDLGQSFSCVKGAFRGVSIYEI